MLQQVIIGVFGVLLCWSSAFGAVGVFGRYDYRAFGEISSHTGATSKYLFTGEQYDSAADSYYLRARYYNPSAGRFLSGDKYKFAPEYTRELNGYGYVAANPVNATDPSGEFALIGYSFVVHEISAAQVAEITAVSLALTCQIYIAGTALEYIAYKFGGNVVPLPNVPWFCKAHQVRAQLQKTGAGPSTEGSAVAYNNPSLGVTVRQMYDLLQPFVPGSRKMREFPSKSLEAWLVTALNSARKAVWQAHAGGGLKKDGENFFRKESPWFRGVQWRLDMENLRGWNLRNRG